VRAPKDAREPAVAQSALAPEEPKLGVQRDAGEQRVVQVSPVFFEAMLIASQQAHVPPQFFEEWGFAWGRLAVVDLEAESLERFETLMRDLPMVTVAEFVSDHVRRKGWGRPTFDFALAARGAFVVDIERSVIAELPGRAATRRCELLAGFFRAVLGHLAHKKLVVREIRCAALGAPHCELLAMADDRAAALDAAIAGGVDSAARAVEKVAGGRVRGV
jgi:hypothetical protein